MKKIIFCFVLISLLITSSLWCKIEDEPGANTDFNFTLIPYYGGVGVNLGSLLYAQHTPSASGVTWDYWEGKENEESYWSNDLGVTVPPSSVFLPVSNGYSNKYSDYHIIALGGAYNIPFSNGTRDYVDSYLKSHPKLKKKLNLPSNASNILIPKEKIVLTIDAVCDSNFEFVSQSNPIYRRPFQIEVFPRVRTGNGADFADPYTSEIYLIETGSSSYEIKMPTTGQTNVNFTDNYLTMLAADMVLVLPYDYANYLSGGGYFSGGLTYNNATYTLADLDDYTAVVTITLTLNFEYSYIDNGERDTRNYTDSRVITIPFSGFYTSSDNRDIRGSSISLFVNATNEAANLNLARQGEWITVGSIQFLFNEKVKKDAGFPSENEDIVRIFLSASAHPEIQSSSKFKMVHEHATSVVTNTNSLGFTARVRGTGSNVGDILLSSNGDRVSNVVEFDGLAFMGNIAGGSTPGSVDVVKTVCNTGRVSNNWDGGKRHFHTFEGDIDIKFDESSMLEAGIYRGYIYVHAVTED